MFQIGIAAAAWLLGKSNQDYIDVTEQLRIEGLVQYTGTILVDETVLNNLIEIADSKRYFTSIGIYSHTISYVLFDTESVNKLYTTHFKRVPAGIEICFVIEDSITREIRSRYTFTAVTSDTDSIQTNENSTMVYKNIIDTVMSYKKFMNQKQSPSS